jgi:hypothetical protein
VVHEHFDELSAFLHHCPFVSINEDWSHDHFVKSIQVFFTTFVSSLCGFGIGIWMINVFVLTIRVIDYIYSLCVSVFFILKKRGLVCITLELIHSFTIFLFETCSKGLLIFVNFLCATP